MNSDKLKKIFSCLILMLISMGQAQAAIITFDDAISGMTSFSYDGDGDTINDVIFSTTDPSGFNTAGPGSNMSYIDEPGLEGTTSLAPDLRVDFLNGAVNSFNFGYAVLAGGLVSNALTFSVFDSLDNLLSTVVSDANNTATTSGLSDFPEAFVTTTFSGVASYALFDFDNSSRYILDNFEGTFGSTEDITPVPEPLTIQLFILALLALFSFTRSRYSMGRNN